ncbi:3-oxoacyl-ACP synthase [Marinitoga aeolica]|uniref:3-oxoacyl-ACP synthase n=1 Tax=Marinitoga aeolica TaxID=2809031 RepID=A0ABY8PR66_9BACT|nr:3-oxoacyl-ACP synthase [Marinitoga aeolica]WGS65113.1 3-oxoacyl-ACP synthase [Marinitoga aeolica]
MNVGIMGIGTYIPETYITAEEISEKSKIPIEVIKEKFGVLKKPIPGPNDTTSYMGIKAAEKAIENADINPEEIDLIIWNGGQHKDYPCWLAGLKVANEIGAVNAWSFDMEAMCGSMMSGMEVARSMMIANEDLNTVLLVSGYRNGDLINYNVKETSFMFDIGAGGAAMVLRKNYNKNVILGTAFKGDGSFSEDCVVEVGGTKKWPMEEKDVNRLHFVVRDVESFKEKLKEKTMPNFYYVIDKSLEKSKLSRKNIDYLAILHFKRSAHYAVLEELGLREEQSIYLENYGHIGQNDQILSIELGLKSGKIKDGNNIVMVGAGLGFVWASAVVKWGEFKG